MPHLPKQIKLKARKVLQIKAAALSLQRRAKHPQNQNHPRPLQNQKKKRLRPPRSNQGYQIYAPQMRRFFFEKIKVRSDQQVIMNDQMGSEIVKNSVPENVKPEKPVETGAGLRTHPGRIAGASPGDAAVPDTGITGQRRSQRGSPIDQPCDALADRSNGTGGECTAIRPGLEIPGRQALRIQDCICHCCVFGHDGCVRLLYSTRGDDQRPGIEFFIWWFDAWALAWDWFTAGRGRAAAATFWAGSSITVLASQFHSRIYLQMR